MPRPFILLTLAWLVAAGCLRYNAPAPTPADKPGGADFESRLQAAQAIRDITKRDDALLAVAAAAADAAQGETVKRAINSMRDVTKRDKAASSSAVKLAEAGDGAAASRNEDLPWNRRDHALFVSYAPFDAPRLACSVVVEHGGGGSLAAAPIARDIILQALYGGKPPLDAYPSSQRGTIRTRQEKLELRDPASFRDGRVRA